MTAHTGNGFPVITQPTDKRLRTWTIPGANRRITLRDGHIGFVGVYWIDWYDEYVERLDAPGNDPVDEGGWNPRRIANTNPPLWSEHAGAAAFDLNWNRHPSGTPIARTFTKAQIARIRGKVRWMNALALGKVIEWGGEWPTHKGSTAPTDGMHYQLVIGRLAFLARILSKNKRGRAILKANPGVVL